MNKYCCINCFSDSEIKNFIESYEINETCDYCDSKDIDICDVTDVGNFIMEGFLRYYEDAANQVGYCSADGGYQMDTSNITEILLHQECLLSDNLSSPNDLLKDLISDDGTPYVRKDPYGPPSGDPDEIKYWENFCQTVKTKQRFTTFLSSEDDEKYDQGSPKHFLFHLANNFMPSLIGVLPPGTKIYRARINNDEKKLLHKDLTSPPPESSKNNRMSPFGISFFYGGRSPEVCIHEVRPNVAENIVIAEFQVARKLFILDLSLEVEAYKSIFDPEYYFSNEEFFKPFLEHFSNDISKPIRKSDNEIEYIPTQVFTEFIKTINFNNHYYCQDSNTKAADVFIDGIQFKSSIMKDGTNLVLFKGPEISTTLKAKTGDAWLFYKGKKSYQVTEIKIKTEKTKAQSGSRGFFSPQPPVE